MQKIEIRKWVQLNSKDKVAIIAPASRCTSKRLELIKALLTEWQLQYYLPQDIFGNDLLCANTDEIRFEHLKHVLLDSEIKAIFCVRGGYGSAHLIPFLEKMPVPPQPKILVGMSDITALNIYLQQKWHWPVLHAAFAPDKFSAESIQAIHEALFHGKINFPVLQPLNLAAQQDVQIEADITGGNLALIQTSIGTSWQIEPKNKILLLEEVNERAFRIDRMLVHLQQAGIFAGVKAILLGDFLGGEEPNGKSLVQPVLQRFADRMDIPVLKCEGIGHGATNCPVPFNVPVQLQLGKAISIEFKFN